MTATRPTTIGLTRNFALGIPYWTIMEHSARARARELGAECCVFQSLSPSEQALSIESLIRQQVDVIVVAAIVPDHPEFVAALQRARTAGIPLVAADVPLPLPVQCLIRSDDRKGAASAAAYAVDWIGGHGTLVHLQGDMRSPVAQVRSLGVHDIVDEFPGVAVIETAEGEWNRERARAYMERILAEQPTLSAVVASNDPMALGALDALQAAGRSAVVTGVDGDAEALLALENGDLGATVKRSPYEMGRTAIEIALELARGGSVQPEVLLEDMALVTQASVTSAALDTLSILPGVLDGLMLNSTLLDAERTALRTIIDSLPDIIYVKDGKGNVELANQATAALLGVAHPDALLGKSEAQLFPADVAERHGSEERAVRGTGQPITNQEEVLRSPAGAERWFLTTTVPVRNAEGRVERIVVRSQDITERKQAEQERQQLQDALIKAQANALRELSTPLLSISDEALVMPLIGAIDTERAQQILDTLLSGVSAKRATAVILDITGVPVVDTQVASALLHAAQAVKLLGARMVLTGVRPEVAQTLVQLGVELHGLMVCGTLRDGINYALRR